MTLFLELIYPLKTWEGEDTLLWKDDGRGKFSVKLYYNSLRSENNLVFPAKEIWGSCAHPKTCFFFCLGNCLGEILTIDMLMKWG